MVDLADWEISIPDILPISVTCIKYHIRKFVMSKSISQDPMNYISIHVFHSIICVIFFLYVYHHLLCMGHPTSIYIGMYGIQYNRMYCVWREKAAIKSKGKVNPPRGSPNGFGRCLIERLRIWKSYLPGWETCDRQDLSFLVSFVLLCFFFVYFFFHLANIDKQKQETSTWLRIVPIGIYCCCLHEAEYSCIAVIETKINDFLIIVFIIFFNISICSYLRTAPVCQKFDRYSQRSQEMVSLYSASFNRSNPSA